MAVSDEYTQYVLDQLEALGSVTAKRMFGGVGLYCEELFFGLIDNDVLYFKVDEQTKHRYESAGSVPFRPYGQDSKPMSYYEVPVSVLEDRDKLKAWAKEALAVASRKAAGKSPKRPTRGRRP